MKTRSKKTPIERGEAIAIEAVVETNKVSHSPGPWQFEKHDDDSTYEIWNNNTKIAVVNKAHEVELPSGTDHANARLLAAAHDLLVALELILNDNRLMNALSKNQAKAVMYAVTKARGES